MAKGKKMDAARTLAPVIKRRLVENPLRTAATHEHELRQAEEGVSPAKDAAEVVVWKDGEGNVVAGMIEADVNLTTMIGGLARIRGRSEAQTLAAARFRALFDRAQVGAARAIDYEAVRVDVSGASDSTVFEIGDQARRGYIAAVQRLGMLHSNLLEKVVCYDVSLRDIARGLGEGEGGSARERTKRRVLVAIDVLVEHFGYVGSAPATTRMRVDGEVPRSFTGEIINRKAGH